MKKEDKSLIDVENAETIIISTTVLSGSPCSLVCSLLSVNVIRLNIATTSARR